MAIGALKGINQRALAGHTYVPVSAHGTVFIINSNATTTATANSNLNVSLIATSNFNWFYTGVAGTGGGRIKIRARATKGNITGSPVVKIFSMYANDVSLGNVGDTPTIPTDGTVFFERVDTKDFSAAGLTLTVTSSTYNYDASYDYSNWTSLYDLEGAQYVGVNISTPGTVSAGVLDIQACLVN